MSEKLIVSRHPAAVAFVREELPDWDGVLVKEAVGPGDVTGKTVAGNLPLMLAALCAEVIAIEFEGAPPRGQEYGVEQMREAGARLARYKVTQLD